MIFKINDQFSFPVKSFTDTVFNREDEGVVRSLTVHLEDEITNLDNITSIVGLSEFCLVLMSKDAVIWESNNFNKMSYTYDVSKNEDGVFSSSIWLNFTIE